MISIQTLYNWILRPLLPRKIASYAGVPVRRPRLFDATDTHPGYESGLLSSLRRAVTADDKVTIIGGGHGVSAVVAARTVRHVQVYEAAREMVAVARETARLSLLDDRISVCHKRIEDAGEVWGNPAPSEPVSDIPIGDVLIIDAEGAEIDILEGMDDHPRSIIVEVHPNFGVRPVDIEETLVGQGYRLTRDVPESPHNDEIRVWTARRSDNV